jgi:hypothetical protein
MTDSWNAKLVVAAAINDRSAFVAGRSLNSATKAEFVKADRLKYPPAI